MSGTCMQHCITLTSGHLHTHTSIPDLLWRFLLKNFHSPFSMWDLIPLLSVWLYWQVHWCTLNFILRVSLYGILWSSSLGYHNNSDWWREVLNTCNACGRENHSWQAQVTLNKLDFKERSSMTTWTNRENYAIMEVKGGIIFVGTMYCRVSRASDVASG